MAKETPAQKANAKRVMHAWKTGQLHSGSAKGPVVRSQRQAVAIFLSENGESKKK